MGTRSTVIKAAATEVDAAIVALEGAGNTVTQVIKVTVGQFIIIYTTP